MRRGAALYTCTVKNAGPRLSSWFAVTVGYIMIREKYKFMIDSKKFLLGKQMARLWLCSGTLSWYGVH